MILSQTKQELGKTTMKLCRRKQQRVMRRKQPCFDFVRNVEINSQKKEVVVEDMKKGNLLTNLDVKAVAEENVNLSRKMHQFSFRKIVKLARKIRKSNSNSKPKCCLSKTEK